MRIWIACVLLGPLAACGSGPEAPAAGGNNALAAPPAAADPFNRSEAQELAEWREDMLRGCIGGGRDRAGPNVPVEQHCACAVDRVTEGRSLAQLRTDQQTGEHAARFSATLRQCIAEISPDYPLRTGN